MITAGWFLGLFVLCNGNEKKASDRIYVLEKGDKEMLMMTGSPYVRVDGQSALAFLDQAPRLFCSML